MDYSFFHFLIYTYFVFSGLKVLQIYTVSVQAVILNLFHLQGAINELLPWTLFLAGWPRDS